MKPSYHVLGFTLFLFTTTLASALAVETRDMSAQRITLNNGRTIDGIYDDATGKIEIVSGEVGKVYLSVKSSDINKIENITLQVNYLSNTEREIRNAKLERNGVLINVARVTSALAKIGDPDSATQQCQSAIADLQQQTKQVTADIYHVQQLRDDYARQIALLESTTTTTAVKDTEVSTQVLNKGRMTGINVPVVDPEAKKINFSGDNWQVKYKETIAALSRKREVVVIKKDVSVDAAHHELRLLDQRLAELKADRAQLEEISAFLAKKIIEIADLVKEQAKWQTRLDELNLQLGNN